MPQYDKTDVERRMKGAVESFKSDLSGLRTGRANVTLLDPVVVEVYGSHMPLSQVATVSAPEPRLLSVQVWDRSNVTPVEKAIRSAGLGLNPITDGQTPRLCPIARGNMRFFAQRPLPSIMMATCRGIFPVPASMRSGWEPVVNTLARPFVSSEVETLRRTDWPLVFAQGERARG